MISWGGLAPLEVKNVFIVFFAKESLILKLVAVDHFLLVVLGRYDNNIVTFILHAVFEIGAG